MNLKATLLAALVLISSGIQAREIIIDTGETIGRSMARDILDLAEYERSINPVTRAEEVMMFIVDGERLEVQNAFLHYYKNNLEEQGYERVRCKVYGETGTFGIRCLVIAPTRELENRCQSLTHTRK